MNQVKSFMLLFMFMKARFKFRILIFMCALGTELSVCAQRNYTLDECIQSALDHNVRMKKARNEVRMAEYDRKEVQSKCLPDISAFGTGFIADQGLAQMELTPELRMSMMKDGVIGGVMATAPLFTGGQIINGDRLAKLGVESKRLQENLSGNEVRLQTEQYFWQVVSLKEKLNTLDAVERQLSQLQQDVDLSVQAGVVTRNDLLQVQLRRNEVLSNRLNLENLLSLSRRMLAQYIGCVTDSFDITFHIDDRQPEAPDSLFCDHAQVLSATDEFVLLQKNLKASDLQYKMSVGNNLPKIVLGGGYLYDNLTDKDHPYWVGLATVSIPISGWIGGSQHIKKMKLQVRNAEDQLVDESQLLVLRMQNAWNALNNAYKQIGIARLTIEQAEENLRMNKDLYSAGTCTMTDLLEAQTLYQQGRDKYVEAFTEYEIKKREYLQATGRGTCN